MGDDDAMFEWVIAVLHNGLKAGGWWRLAKWRLTIGIGMQSRKWWRVGWTWKYASK